MSGQLFAWRCAIKHPAHGLERNELLVLHTFALWADSDGVAWPSAGKIAAAAGFKDAGTAKRLLRSAEQKGFIETLTKGAGGASGNTSKRRLTIPAALGATSGPEATGGTGATSTSGRGAMTPVAGEPPEVAREVAKQPRRARAREGTGEAPEFAALLEGVGLRADGRTQAREALGAEPARVTACVEEWWRRKDRKSTTGPGLLVRMVEDGDVPGQNGRRPRRAVAAVSAVRVVAAAPRRRLLALAGAA